ncbi:hypothetical protein N7509_005471 [Penicillium cosmopolitanum]|uniref:NADH-ubiquinone oxidoreductase 21.3 kDa subunit n=1 Tax=Penicillium cosmopolitanum TaxID=1131564 RepID=A0A9W9W285_9EURO|nr:uncharacterized protein N7509_005471 [Penicillium cosmopolitanum]KAJ5397358.1 hypothetical protein N7509_005471 [Penicillium cosmopolitanum]
MAGGAIKAAKAASHVVPIAQKYTLESKGIWDWVRRTLAVDPNRSSVTLPAGDIADNPYWKRDARRNYPTLSTITQADAVSLLTVGSQAAPKDDVLQLGEAGAKQIVSVKAEGEERGLAGYFEKNKTGVASVLGANGLPPSPTNLNTVAKESQSTYQLGTENGYPDIYPCRTFV